MNYFYLIFIIVVSLLALLVGLIYLFDPPRDAKYRYGYRTKYTLMNQENWDLGHTIITTSYLIIGPICLIGMVPILLNFFNDNLFNTFIIVVVIQMLLIASPFIYTHFILKYHTKKNNLKNEHETY